MAYETLQEAQARILELEDEVTQLRTNNQVLSQDNENQKKENDDLRTLNQKYFNKLVMQDTDEGKKNREDQRGSEILSVEEFAKKVKI